jgi:hypothetical protein
MVYQWFSFKTTGTVSPGLTLKMVKVVSLSLASNWWYDFLDLASKLRSNVSSGLASKSVATVSSGLVSKPVVADFSIWVSKLAAMVW